jgi:hypothetical protein
MSYTTFALKADKLRELAAPFDVSLPKGLTKEKIFQRLIKADIISENDRFNDALRKYELLTIPLEKVRDTFIKIEQEFNEKTKAFDAIKQAPNPFDKKKDKDTYVEHAAFTYTNAFKERQKLSDELELLTEQLDKSYSDLEFKEKLEEAKHEKKAKKEKETKEKLKRKRTKEIAQTSDTVLQHINVESLTKTKPDLKKFLHYNRVLTEKVKQLEKEGTYKAVPTRIDPDLQKTFSSIFDWERFRNRKGQSEKVQERFKEFKEKAEISFSGLSYKEQDYICELLDKWVKDWYTSNEISTIADVEFIYSDGSRSNRFSLANENFKALFYKFFKDKPFRYEYNPYDES